MQQDSKRTKISEEGTIVDIAATIESISGSIKSMGTVHSSLLQANKAVVAYLQHVKKRNQESLMAEERPINLIEK